MLTDKPVMGVMPATDVQRAANFYQEKLGLKVEAKGLEEIWVGAGTGTGFQLYKRPEGTRGEHTEATFRVDDVEKEVAELRGRGVVFEEYDMPGIKTINGIATQDSMKSAWFKDTEGNILCVHQG